MLCSSDDLGASWSEPEAAPIRFPEGSELALKNLWQIALDPHEADTVWCGVEPAALFVSRDAGGSWSLVRGLHDHPHRPQWQPGGGGLCLHTVVPDATDRRRLWVGISTAGVYRSDDGGETWTAKNRNIRAPFLPEPYPEFGQCVHKLVQHPARPSTLYLQHHWGVYRSDDAGDSWRDIGRSLPTDFGFPVVAHPGEAETVYVLPLTSDEFRCTPEGQLRVWRTRDGGESWEALARGLPQEHAFETVLRDSMTAMAAEPPGIFFGTRSGKVFGTRDGGESWSSLIDGLPPVVCVRAVSTS
jgi:photosystem II stability/assembly factor-like uncharacterized protein